MTTIENQDSAERYGRVTRCLHWGMAVLMLVQFLSAGAHWLLEDTAIEKLLWPSHKPLGFLLMVLVLVRLGWALANVSRRPPSINLPAKLGHLALYALMVVVPSVALIRQYGSGKPFEPFGLPLMGGFEGDKIEWMLDLGGLLHGELGWGLLALIAGHIVMALWHRGGAPEQNVLPRMWR